MNESEVDNVFEALAHSVRRSIVLAVAQCPRSISSLAKELDYSLPAIHKHIEVLEAAGLVMRRKTGRVNYLSIKRDGLATGQAWIRQFHPHWGNDVETLENYIKALKKETI